MSTDARSQPNSSMLDMDEYFHLALHANATGEHHVCLAYLKEVLRWEPQNARALYLLAVEHAELGMFERSIEEMKAALVIEAGLETARLQLGLLLLDAGRSSEAKLQLCQLKSSADATLRACAEALVALADNSAADARQKLALALSQESGSRPLLSLVQRLLDRLTSEATSDRADVQHSRRFLQGAPKNCTTLEAAVAQLYDKSKS